MQLEELELREIRIPLKHRFETSSQVTTCRRVILVRVFDESGAAGHGECVAAEDPFYSHECTDTAWLIICGFVAPLLAEAGVTQAVDTNSALGPIRGNSMAKGAVEAAIWDLEARLAGRPLWQHICGVRPEIDCGVSNGIQRGAETLLDRIPDISCWGGDGWACKLSTRDRSIRRPIWR